MCRRKCIDGSHNTTHSLFIENDFASRHHSLACLTSTSSHRSTALTFHHFVHLRFYIAPSLLLVLPFFSLIHSVALLADACHTFHISRSPPYRRFPLDQPPGVPSLVAHKPCNVHTICVYHHYYWKRVVERQPNNMNTNKATKKHAGKKPTQILESTEKKSYI